MKSVKELQSTRKSINNVNSEIDKLSRELLGDLLNILTDEQKKKLVGFQLMDLIPTKQNKRYNIIKGINTNNKILTKLCDSWTNSYGNYSTNEIVIEIEDMTIKQVTELNNYIGLFILD